MARGKKGSNVAELPEVKVGDRISIIEDGPRKGQHDAVVEIDHEDNLYRCAIFGWLSRDLFKILDPTTNGLPPEPEKDAAAHAADDAEKRGEFQALVDGAEAHVVLAGKSDAPTNDAMIKPSLEDLVRSLARAHDALEKSTAAKKRATERCKDDQGAVNAIVAELLHHYGHATQLSLGIAATNGAAPVAATEDEDEEEDEEDEAAAATTQVGVRDYRSGEGPE